MGTRRRWCAKSALALLARCFDARSVWPDAIARECTSDFWRALPGAAIRRRVHPSDTGLHAHDPA
eukprot:12332772-Alexandrium_andersonii.AAC.1